MQLKTLALAHVIAASAWALSNSVVVTDTSGSTQTNRPITISRVFAEGEIAEYPQAYISGTGLLTTQADVKSRWSDSSVKHALVSFKVPSITAGAGVTVEFRNQSSGNNTGYLDKAAIAGITFDAEIKGTANAVAQTKTLKNILSGCSSISTDFENLDCRYWQRGSLVTTAIIEDKTSRASDFGWEYTGGAWATASSNTFKSLHPQFVVQIWPDTPTSGLYAIKVDYILESPWTDRMQNQVYDLAVRGGTSSISDLYTLTAWTHPAKSRWRVVKWISNEPGAVFVDFNFEYLIAAKALPQYDTSLVQAVSGPSTDLNTWNTRNVNSMPTFCDATATTCLLWTKFIPQTGGRKDIALIPAWYMHYLYGMSSSSLFTNTQRQQMYDRFIVGLAEAASSIPIHYREHLSTRCFYRADGDATASPKYTASGGCSYNAQGKALSITARPTIMARRGNTQETAHVNTETDDKLTYACTSTTDPCAVPVVDVNASLRWNWETDGSTAHWPSFFYVPYLLTGDWYFLEEIGFQSTFHMAMMFPKTASSSNARIDSWGLLWRHDQARMLWTRRDLALAAWIYPDSTPEKLFFTQKLKNNIAAWEGAMGCTTCTYYGDSVRGSMYTHGLSTWINSKSNPLKFADFRLGVCDSGINQGVLETTCLAEATWQTNYVLMTHGWIAELFPTEAGPIARDTMQNISLRHGTTGYNWMLGAEFHTPIMDGSAQYFTTFSDTLSFMADRCTLTANIGTTDTSILCKSDTPYKGQINIPGGVLFRMDSTGELMRGSVVVGATTTNTSGIGCATGGCNYSIPVTRGWANTTPTAAVIGDTFRVTYQTWHAGRAVDPTGGYPILYLAANAWATGATGQRRMWGRARAAWPYRTAATHSTSSLEHNPQWAFEPRESIGNLLIRPGSTTLLFRWTAPERRACKLETSTSAFTSSDDSSGTTVAASGSARAAVVASLTASTTYYYRVTCGTARTSGSTATLATGSGGASLTLKMAAPTGRNVVDVVVEHGATDTYGTTESAVSCTTTCTVTITGLTSNAIRYLRWSWRTATPTTVAQGTSVAIVP